VTDLREVIEAEHGRWGLAAVDAEVFGTTAPAEIAAVVDEVCQSQFGAAVVSGLFYRASTGCAAGVVLDDGERVVIKVFQSRWNLPFLSAVQFVQRHLSAAGFPSPEPLGTPTPLPVGPSVLATFERYVPDPGLTPLAGDEERRASAAGLARQIQLCRHLDAPGLAEHPLNAHCDDLYPQPHSPLFDFGLAAAEAGWIDDFAHRASELRRADTSEPVVAHTDWSARNIRVRGDALVVAYDWDSLCLVPESTAVGQGAATWCVTSDPGGTEFPSAASMAGFVRDYEAERGASFTPTEWRAVSGAALWVVAYIARCEHAIDAAGLARGDQQSARTLLRTEGHAIGDLEANEVT
jgi:Phosphotransferase enzyme family